MIPRSSSGEFHAVFSPWVAVNAPPSGGPTSSPKTSVTPRFSSASWRPIRMACAVLALVGGGDPPPVVGDHDQQRELLPLARAPHQAGGEVALRRSRVAAGDDGDPVPAVALLGQRGARGHGVLDLDGRADRGDVP